MAMAWLGSEEIRGTRFRTPGFLCYRDLGSDGLSVSQSGQIRVMHDKAACCTLASDKSATHIIRSMPKSISLHYFFVLHSKGQTRGSVRISSLAVPIPCY